MARHTRHSPTTMQKMEKKDILIRLEDSVLRGVSNQVDLADAFSLAPATISHYLKEIKQSWLDRNEKDHEVLRISRIKQLEKVHSISLQAFEESKSARQSIQTYEKRCNNCKGEGRVDKTIDGSTSNIDKPLKVKCENCRGVGKFIIERITREAIEGNPQFLKIAIEAIREAAKLEGVSPGSISLRKISKTNANGEIDQTLEELYYEAPADLIIEARAVFDKLKQRNKQRRIDIKQSKADQNDNQDNHDIRE